MALVKICGLQTLAHVEEVSRLPVDYIGFVFARSKRQVTPETAGELIGALRSVPLTSTHRPQAVGVFVNPTLGELADVLAKARLDVIQLHGVETPTFCREVKERWPQVNICKVFTLKAPEGSGDLVQESERAGEAAAALQLEPYRDAVDGMLLDTFDPVYGGGSGKTFAWEAIPAYQAWCREAGIPLLVAGGLQPDNVGDLLGAYAPDGVDVSSGVETDGVKDLAKIASFVERVRDFV
ncbi:MULTISPECIES: phosphoribosylanthranilate isomerase [Paenibacillus]|uniref:phosphoribosylanthranilate isomerase n=1 Tax=Paenibacillus TaxID=44249 RepID=UPI0022B8E7E0|nr:phosphoribosylanthranilate isomerase [Paenibacillus caseinilyticus]MCZ8520526.1 phosphoribosylanthranilate isomerase [Paenibacillus caseinilyticus]